MVMTPVPPTPATITPQACSATGSTGSGTAGQAEAQSPVLVQRGTLSESGLAQLRHRSTVMKLGQKPLVHE